VLERNVASFQAVVRLVEWCGCSYSALAEGGDRGKDNPAVVIALARTCQICATSTSHSQAIACVYTANQPPTLATHVARYTHSLRTSRLISHKHHPSWPLPSTRCATTTVPNGEKLLLTRFALQIKQIEDEMAKTQKNKATSFHLGTHSHSARPSNSQSIQY
jgi:hypothetical protein